jgi:rhodanese-related sulfurtransferase
VGALTPEQRIKREILLRWNKQPREPDDDAYRFSASPHSTGEEVDALFEELRGEWLLSDIESEFREGEIETNIGAPCSRHYESRSVAAKLCDGGYVGWVYWYGGGKHGEPSAIDWMNEAYELTITERKTVEVLVFAKVEPSHD